MAIKGKTYPLNFVMGFDDKASRDFKKSVRGLNKIAGGVKSAGKIMSVGLTAPIVSAGVASARFAVQFQKEMANVSTLIDTTEEDIGGIGDKVMQIGGSVPIDLSNATSALYDIRSASISASDSMVVLEQSGRLGVAGLGTTQEAADLVTSSINAFGLEGEKARLVYDNIFKTVKSGKTNISQLAVGFGSVAGTIAANNIELDEYLSSVAALTTTGQPASQAHTQIKAAVSGLTRKTSESIVVFRRLGGKSLPDLIKKYGGLVPVLKKISDHYSGDKAKILKLVGSTEALNAVLGLTGGQAKAQSDALALMRNGVNAVDEAFDKQSQTISARMKLTENKMRVAAIKIGNVIIPVLGKLTDTVGDMLDGFNELSESQKEWIVITSGIAAAAGPVLLVGGKMMLMWLEIKTALSGIKAAQKAAGAAAGPSANLVKAAWAGVAAPIAAVAAAIASVGYALYRLNELSNSLGEDGISGTFSRMLDNGDFSLAGFAEANDQLMNERASSEAGIDENLVIGSRNREDFIANMELQRAANVEALKKDAQTPFKFPDQVVEEKPGAPKMRVELDFANMPIGTHVGVDVNEEVDGYDLSMGYANGESL